MTTEQLKEVYLDQKASFSKKQGLIDRDIDLSVYLKTSQVVVVSGVRRSGKSSLLYLISRELQIKVNVIL